jgi:hypothetical protein
LEVGADRNFLDLYGNTPLHKAAEKGIKINHLKKFY